MKTKLILRILAPYLAVTLFWWILPNAWLAIAAYHVQILLNLKKDDLRRTTHTIRRPLTIAYLSALAGPLLYLLHPYILPADLSTRLSHYGLTRLSLTLMIPYFGLVHPSCGNTCTSKPAVCYPRSSPTYWPTPESLSRRGYSPIDKR